MRTRNPLIEKEHYTPDKADSSSRAAEISQVVLHTTGGGLVQKALDLMHPGKTAAQLHNLLNDPGFSLRILRYAMEYYAAHNGVSTHFIIGYYGEIWQLCDENRRAWSAGIKPRVLQLYQAGYEKWRHFYKDSLGRLTRDTKPERQNRYQFWCEMFNEILGAPPAHPIPAAASPLQFTEGPHGPDQISISIDFLAPVYQRHNEFGVRCLGPAHPLYDPGELYSNRQILSMNQLLNELATQYPAFKLDRRHVLPHSFTDPISRHLYVPTKNGSVGYGYDPGPLPWDRLLAPA